MCVCFDMVFVMVQGIIIVLGLHDQINIYSMTIITTGVFKLQNSTLATFCVGVFWNIDIHIKE